MLITEEKMLEIWALRRHSTDIRNDSALSRPEGSPDLAIMRQEMRAWYFNLLATAPAEILHVYELKGSFGIEPTPDEGQYAVTLPEEFLRLESLVIRTSAGERQVRLVQPDSRTGLFQRNPRTMAGPCVPVAYIPAPGAGKLRIFCKDIKAPEIVSLRAITLPPEGKYAITEAALATIPAD